VNQLSNKHNLAADT